MALIDRLRNAFGRHDVNQDIDEEMRFHVDARIRDNIASGMSPADARRDARQRFGSQTAAREDTRSADVLVSLETVVQDIGYALRSLRKQPVFTFVAVLTLALGIGANSAIFTVVYNVLIRPLPFPESENLAVVTYQQQGGLYWLHPGMADSHYVAFSREAHPFEAAATFASAPQTLSGGGEPLRLKAATVTPDFFRVLRVNAAIGRTFLPGEAESGDRVVILGDTLWRSRFGADPDLVGRSITLDGVAHTVIGVMPPSFSYPPQSVAWTPLHVRLDPRMGFTRPVIARVKSGTTMQQAQSAWESLARSLPGQPRAGDREWNARVIPLKDAFVGNVRRPLLIFSGAVALVLLIACANVSNLLMMRTLARRQEIATRLALGAARARVLRQLLTETTVLALAGGTAGTIVTMASVPALLSFVPDGRLPRANEIQVDGWVLLFSFALAVVSGVVLGLVPAIHGTRAAASGPSREPAASATRGSNRFRYLLVVSEVAMALVLLVGAGLLLRSFLRLTSVDPGFQASHVMTMTVDLPQAQYQTAAQMHDFHDRLLGTLSVLPDVAAAGAVNWMPLSDMVINGDVQLRGGHRAPPDYRVTKASISPGYLRVMGIRLVRGREFSDADTSGAPGVVIVSESVAKRLWPGEDAMGQQLSVVSRPTEADWLTVVGVVAEVRHSGFKDDLAAAVYQPYWQNPRPGWLSRMNFVVRTGDSPERIAPAMRAALVRADRNLAPQSMATLEDLLAGTIAEPRFQTRLLVLFSALALVLAAIGVYGVLSASVAERRREIGIRIALGAERSAMVRMVLLRVLVLASLGVTVGVGGALALTRVLTRLLFETTPTDTTTFAVAVVLLLGVALVAGWVPAKRASTVDPVRVLRAE